jgi:hypothetical protein
MSERYDETASKCDIVLKEARKDADEAYKNICDIINVYVLLEGATDYEELVKTLNAVIAKYGVRHRHHTAHTEANSSAAEEIP